jgi:hypothetical protein
LSIIDRVPLERALWWNAAAFAAVLALCCVLYWVDPRQIEGVSAWVKPSKFALSFGVHLATLALIAAWTQRSSRLFTWSVLAIIATAWVEFALIALQAARGVRSHFNVESPFDAAVFTVMGVGVGALFLASVVAAMALILDRTSRSWPAIASSAAILAGALGSLTALAMVAPTESQIAGFEQGVRVSSGARFPGGGEDVGPQIPYLGWSLERGDYRIAHFFGVHALQIVLVWGWLIRNAAAGPRLVAFAALLMANAATVAVLFWAASQDIGIANAPMPVVIALAVAFAAQPVVTGLAWAASRRTG